MRITSTGEVVARTNTERPVRPVEGAPPVQSVEPDPPAGRQMDRQALNHVVTKMNSAADIFNKALHFKVSEGNRVIVKVINTTSGEVVLEIPPEKLIEAFESLEEHLGVLFDRKV